MNHLEKLDAVLKLLEKYHSEGYKDLIRVHAMLQKEYPAEEFWGTLGFMLEELEANGHVKVLKPFNDGSNAYVITYKGRIFNHFEGYNKKWKETRRMDWPKRNWLLFGVITFLMGLTPTFLKCNLSNDQAKNPQSPVQVTRTETVIHQDTCLSIDSNGHD